MYKIEDIVNTIICGNTSTELKKFPNESINCVITSPPYWGLRDYGLKGQIWDGDSNCEHQWVSEKKLWHSDRGKGTHSWCAKCNAWCGSLGLEPTFQLYLEHLWQIFDEVKRILKLTGTCWVNMGDTYHNATKWTNKEECPHTISKGNNRDFKTGRRINQGLEEKTLCQIPSRFSIGMSEMGWILRNEIIWYKRNCMPASTKDRFTVDFEKIYFFVKSSDTQYWINKKTGIITDKQPLGTKGIKGIDWDWKKIENSWERPSRDGVFKTPSRMKSTYAKEKKKKVSYWEGKDYWFEQQYDLADYDGRKDTIFKGGVKYKGSVMPGQLGHSFFTRGHERWQKGENGNYIRNRRCVWDIPTRPFKDAHFAVFPEALVRPMILSGCPEFVCKKCGQAREKIVKSKFTAHDGKINSKYDPKTKDGGAARLALLRQAAREQGEEYHQELKFLGYTDCGCNAGFEGGIVLDPFAGAGTGGVVSKQLNRNYILIDLSPEYCKMAEKRINNVQGSLF